MLVSHGAAAAEDSTRTAPGVVVSASRIPVPAKEIGSAVTVVTGVELEQRQVRVLSDVFRDIPGLAVSRNGPIGGLTQLRMRGAEANQTLVLIDGIEVNNPAAGSEFNFAGLLATDIERVEVLRGPQSALYGSDAIGGVVNILTAKPGRGLSFGAHAEGGSFATQQGTISIGYGGERFYVYGLVDHLRTKGISVADEDAGNSEADGFENTSVRVKAGAAPIEGFALDVVGIRTRGHAESDTDAAMVNFIDGGDEIRTIQNFGSAKATFALYDGMWEHIVRASVADTATDYLGAFGTFLSEGRKYKFDYQSNFKFATPNMANAERTPFIACSGSSSGAFQNAMMQSPIYLSIVPLRSRMTLVIGVR